MSEDQNPPSILDFQGSVASAGTDHDKGFHPGWRAAEHDVGVSFKAPWEDPFSGFPEHARRCARSLNDAGLVVHLRSIDPSMQFQQRFEGGADSSNVVEQYKEMISRSVKSYLVEICQVVADDSMLQRLVTHRFMEPEDLKRINRYKIISTVFERDRVSPDAVRCLNAVAQVWVANNKDVSMLVGCGVHPDRVCVVPIPHFPDDPLLELRGRQRQPGPVRFYHIGKWEHRKAHHEMVGAFMMAFKPSEAKLYFKTSTKAPDFGIDYPSSPEASIKLWLQDKRTADNGWDLRAANGNIFLIKQRITAERIRQLHKTGDVYLSMSRGEGFDMPAYDAKLAGNLMVYTPSGGPQDFAAPDDVLVQAPDTVQCHPFYRWGDARYLDWPIENAVAGLRDAKQKIEAGWSTAGHDLSHLSASSVGSRMKDHVTMAVENVVEPLPLPVVETGRPISFADTGSRWSGDSSTYPICADLSRADWLVLHELCHNKNVVEIGCGGSTLMLSSIAASLVSYESNEEWIKRVADRLSDREHRCSTTLIFTGEAEPTKLTLPPASGDVCFIDCYAKGRDPWLSWALLNNAANKIVIHDSRRDSTLESLRSLYHCPEALHIQTVDYHWHGSNMLVITPRQEPTVYENWNETETEHREKHLHHG